MTQKKLDNTKDKKWDFEYEEQVFDHYGINLAGIITNGSDFLFYHVLPDEENGELFCHIYKSIWMMDEACCYLWTAENDERLINTLNDTEDFKSIGKILDKIEFSTEKKEKWI